jgi:polyisoprenoid-binding protein YceI
MVSNITARHVEKPTITTPNFEVEGSLELRGVRASLKFATILNNLADGALGAEAHFDFDRTGWKIICGSSRFFEHSGLHLVCDHISVQARIVAR